MRISRHYFIDATFHHPPEYSQLLLIMYIDKIKNLKIPSLYILMNGKNEDLYDNVFNSVINIITQNRSYELEINTIVTDAETALINSIKKFFSNTKRISCLFHYKQAIIRNIRHMVHLINLIKMISKKY